MRLTSRLLLSTAAIVLAGSIPAQAAWQPQKPIEFVATAGPGGGTDNLARAVQNIVDKTRRGQDDARKALEDLSPQRRLMTPEEVAHVVALLVNDGARGINGQAIALDGGQTMR